tara:strand:+ start:12609 stop:13430 length:822 start_codon:yes stop_codon:yes gene_type:complete
MNIDKNNNIFYQNNYKPLNLLENKDDILNEYCIIFNEFIFHYMRTAILKDSTQYSYILIKGIEMLNHIFNMLFIYTKNHHLIKYQLKKSYLYYVEFINQIRDEGHSFLQLTSKDAILYVYKKTIFEINNDFKKKYSSTVDEKEIINNILQKTNIYVLLLTHVINSKYMIENTVNSKNEIHKLLKQSLKIYHKFIKVNNLKNNETLELVKELLNLINLYEINIHIKLDIISYFINKLQKNTITVDKLRRKFYDLTTKDKLISNSNRCINGFFSK